MFLYLIEDPEKMMKDEKERAIEEFNIEEESYEEAAIIENYKGMMYVPHLTGTEDSEWEIRLPHWSTESALEHEMRHLTHYNIIKEVVKDNREGIERYWENDLKELEPDPYTLTGLFYDTLTSLNSLKDNKNPSDYDIASLNDCEAAQAIFFKQSGTSIQTETYADNGMFSPYLGTAVGALGSTVFADDIDIISKNLDTVITETPLYGLRIAVGIGMLAGVTGLCANWASKGYLNEQLTDENLSELDVDERSVAMLHNERLESDLDDTLDRLARHGIQ